MTSRPFSITLINWTIFKYNCKRVSQLRNYRCILWRHLSEKQNYFRRKSIQTAIKLTHSHDKVNGVSRFRTVYRFITHFNTWSDKIVSKCRRVFVCRYVPKCRYVWKDLDTFCAKTCHKIMNLERRSLCLCLSGLCIFLTHFRPWFMFSVKLLRIGSSTFSSDWVF